MWALASGNTNLADFARILLATEIQSVQYYWHLYPHATWETPYPEQALRNLVTIGNVQSVQAGAWIWWGAEKSEIASIQLLPYHPISELIVDKQWAQAMYNYTSVEFSDPTVGDGWKGYIYMAHAVFDPVAGFSQAKALTDFDTGNTYTNTLWWIATRAKTSSAPICSGSVEPITYSKVYLQSKSTKLYVTVPAVNQPLLVNSASPAASSAFLLQWGPGGYNLNSSSVGKWVTADNAGAAPLAASRDTASTWETFTFTAISGGYYTIVAAANSQLVAVQGNQELVANVAPTANPPDSALFQVYNAASMFSADNSLKMRFN